MKYYSTRHSVEPVSLQEAVIKGLPADNGLFMPEKIHELPASFLENLHNLSFEEIGFQVADTFTNHEIPEADLREMVKKTLHFDAPLVRLDENISVLELFHGNTLAFKDFGARFMAQLMSYFVQKSEKTLHILVATSGDTGSAVAHGFLGVPNITVTVLYPKGKVSLVQEKQFTTLGQNITALEIDGTFDDCQRLVKTAFLDEELQNRFFLTSANSINISRLIPQSFYYFRAAAQMSQKPVFVVPSGNFGNITAGLLAQKMGLSVAGFVAATNANSIVAEYIETGKFEPRASVQTISNAMDVGNPSNFMRMTDLMPTVEGFREKIKAYSYTDTQTYEAIAEVKEKYNYLICPHGAVAYLAAKDYLKENPTAQTVILGTAHHAKFGEVVEKAINASIEIPEQLQQYVDRPKKSIPLSSEYDSFKAFLVENLK